MPKQTIKVIFLDIDGVMVNRASFSLPDSGSASHAIAHPDCVAALNKITKETGAYIVVSSVWRHCGLMQMKDILSGWGVTGKVLGCTPDLCRKEGSIYLGLQRGDEIQKWLDDFNRWPVESFVILDDDSDMKHLMPHLIKTEFETGLTMEHARRAIELLSVSCQQCAPLI
jgi:hypothetical protein